MVCMPPSICNAMSQEYRASEWKEYKRSYDCRGDLIEDGDEVWLVPGTFMNGEKTPMILVDTHWR